MMKFTYKLSSCCAGHHVCCGIRGVLIHPKHFQCRGTELELSECDIYNMSSGSNRYGAELSCTGMYIIYTIARKFEFVVACLDRSNNHYIC